MQHNDNNKELNLLLIGSGERYEAFKAAWEKIASEKVKRGDEFVKINLHVVKGYEINSSSIVNKYKPFIDATICFVPINNEEAYKDAQNLLNELQFQAFKNVTVVATNIQNAAVDNSAFEYDMKSLGLVTCPGIFRPV